jgi:hypothetical protein
VDSLKCKAVINFFKKRKFFEKIQIITFLFEIRFIKSLNKKSVTTKIFEKHSNFVRKRDEIRLKFLFSQIVQKKEKIAK